MKKVFILLFVFLLVSCVKQPKVITSDKIAFIKSFHINVTEPSGLSFDNGFLWIVSDQNGKIYKTDTLGNEATSFKIDGKDLEAITVVSDSVIAVALEQDRTIILLTKQGEEINRFSVDLEIDFNSGFEGLTYNPVNNHFYVLNEKNPKMILEFDQDFNEIKRQKLDFADDYSGICYDSKRDAFWVISHESKSISLCNYNFDVIDSFRVNVPQMEGIGYSPIDDRLYIVSDIEGMLFIYQLKK